MSLWMALILCKRKKKVASKKRDDKRQQIYNLLEKANNNYQKRALFLATEKGASNWLFVIPVDEHGFSLHKRAFRDALALRYFSFENCPTHCVCGKSFSIEHASSCHCGGYTSMMRFEILLAVFLVKSVTLLKSNHICRPSLVRHFHIDLL